MNTRLSIELRTYNEWAALGFKIKKGERSGSRNTKDIAVFGRQQVEPFLFIPKKVKVDTTDMGNSNPAVTLYKA